MPILRRLLTILVLAGACWYGYRSYDQGTSIEPGGIVAGGAVDVSHLTEDQLERFRSSVSQPEMALLLTEEFPDHPELLRSWRDEPPVFVWDRVPEVRYYVPMYQAWKPLKQGGQVMEKSDWVDENNDDVRMRFERLVRDVLRRVEADTRG